MSFLINRMRNFGNADASDSSETESTQKTVAPKRRAPAHVQPPAKRARVVTRSRTRLAGGRKRKRADPDPVSEGKSRRLPRACIDKMVLRAGAPRASENAVVLASQVQQAIVGYIIRRAARIQHTESIIKKRLKASCVKMAIDHEPSGGQIRAFGFV